jgi:hypothetical protein
MVLNASGRGEGGTATHDTTVGPANSRADVLLLTKFQ